MLNGLRLPQRARWQGAKAPAAAGRRVACRVAELTHSALTAEVTTLEEAKELITKLRAENTLLRQKLGIEAAATVVVEPTVVPETAAQPRAGGNLADGIVWPKPGETFWERSPRSAPAPVLAGSGAPSVPMRDPRPLHIVHMTAEMAPIAKVGGLGDVVTGLARSCIARGHTVNVIMPFYECLPKDQVADLKHERDFDVPKGIVWDGQMQLNSLRTSAYTGKIAGVPVTLLRPADWEACKLFRGTRIYGGSYNEMEAYLYLSRAGLEYLRVSGQQPHVLQLHDWHSAAASMLYWDVYNAQNMLSRPRIVLTIHNLDNTGECRQDEFAYTGVAGETFATIEKALDERTIGHNPERLNLMKGAIVYSTSVTTVSPTYAREVMDGGAAGWLRSLFGREDVRGKVRGILNGIDAEEWDPASDVLLPACFSPDQPGGKALCKEFLQKGLGLEVDPTKPLVAVVSRLVPQKGIHLIKAAIYRTVQQGGQFVLLGSGHSDSVFKGMANGEFKDHPNVKLMIMYSERLAHMVYGAADMIVVPSMFEPCGLTQLIALRYGAAPVVRRTGGLADTIRDCDNDQGPQPPNGFVFEGTDEASLFAALDRACDMYRNKKEAWTELCLRNMREDVSWGGSAKSYVDLYNSISVQ